MTFYEVDKIILGKIGIAPNIYANMTISDVITAVNGYLESEYEILDFIRKTIWEAARTAVYTSKLHFKNLKDPKQLWKHDWDKPDDIKMDEINRRLELANTIFPKQFPYNI